MVRFAQEFWESLTAYQEAHRMIHRQRWWGWLLLPGLLHVGLLLLIVVVAWSFSDELLTFFLSIFGMSQEVGEVPLLQLSLRVLLIWILRALILTIYLLLFKQLVVILLAPVFAYLSERTEQQLTGRTYPFRFRYFLKDVGRGVVLGMRNLGIELLWLGAMFLVSFIPVVGMVSPVVIVIVESYFLGFSMVDYYLERQRLSVRVSTHFVWRHKGMALGNGAGFLALMLLPVIGWMIAPVYAVIAGTIAVHRIQPTHARDQR